MNETELDVLLAQLCEDGAEYAETYGEPGYTLANGGKGILLHDWNNVPEETQKLLEAEGFELEWCDEWTVDYDTSPSKAYRTEPDCFDWQPSFRLTEDGELLTPDSSLFDWLDSAKCAGLRIPDACAYPDKEWLGYGFVLWTGKVSDCGYIHRNETDFLEHIQAEDARSVWCHYVHNRGWWWRPAGDIWAIAN